MTNGKVTADISMSLDGFIAGPNDRPEEGLGEGGERLHEWAIDLASFHERHGYEGGEQNQDSEVLDEAFRNAGAILIGRTMFDLAEEPWGPDPPFHMPVFVVTHRERDTIDKSGTTFTFVTDGIEAALEQARAAAGERDVSVGGGASVIQQLLALRLIDELQIHVVPFLLGGGKPLFDGNTRMEFERLRVIDSPTVTHLKYRVLK